MAPIDWEHLMVLNPDEMEEEEADRMFETLAVFEADAEDDPKRLQQLFRVSQAVMQVKAAQAEVAMEELEKKETKSVKFSTRKEQELLDEISVLKRELKDAKRYGADSAQGGSTARDTRFLRDEIHELERQTELLQHELRERERELSEEKKNCDRFAERAEKAEGEVRDLKRESDQLREDIRDYQRQLESQRESLLMRRGEDVEARDKITQRNKDLINALDENRMLAEANESLQMKADEMRKNLEEATRQMEKTTDDYLKLKSVVQTSDSSYDKLQRQNEMLQAQVADLLEQVRSKGDADDEIMVQVNDKVEQWKAILQDKEQELAEYQDEIVHLREQLMAARMDSEKASVAVLTKAVEERDKQLELLQAQLEKATAELDTNTAIIEDMKAEMNKGGGTAPSERQQMKLTNLQSTLKLNEAQTKEAESRMLQAEADARKKDRELSEALEKMGLYEAGIYGLSEAVAEIKECKQQISVRDRQVEDLTQHINKCEMKINDLYEEGEDLRERLGLDPKEPLDMTEFRKVKQLQHQQDRALNQVLQKEVERLEEERINLKQHIRKLAQKTGQRAVALGLTADDMVAIEGFTETLRTRNQPPDSTTLIMKEAEADEFKIRNQQLEKDIDKVSKENERLRQENSELRAINKNLDEDSTSLSKAFMDLKAALHESDGIGGKVVDCPSLDRLVAILDAKGLAGKYDSSVYLKAQVDNLQGRNDELRAELREARHEANKSNLQLDKAQTKVVKLEEDMKAMKAAGAGGMMFQTMALPEGMAATSTDVIASLNEHLVQVLQELSLKEDLLGKMEESLENYKRKFAVIRHQKGLLYDEYINEKKVFDESRVKLEEQVKDAKSSTDGDQIKIAEFNRLLDSLSQEDVEVRRRLADMTRKITVLRVNEKSLTRRFQAVQEVETALRKENAKLKQDKLDMESAIMERLGYLQRYKDMNEFKVNALQKALDDSVPGSELDKANKEFTNLTEKYRDLLEKGNTLVEKTEQYSGFEVEVKRYKNETDMLRSELQVEKEKLHTLEAAMEDLRRQGVMGKGIGDSELLSISKKLTLLEMKELNERQRAEHAMHMYEQSKAAIKSLEDRNMELEQKFAEVTRLNIEAQRTERELRDELSNCVTKAVSDADRKRVNELEAVEAKLRDQVDTLKDISDIATMQAKSIENQRTNQEKELTSLRQQLLDFQAQSNEKTVIGKLHRHIVQLQVSEGMAVRKLEEAQKSIKKLNAQLLRVEQKLDERSQTIYHNRLEQRSKAKHLKKIIHELRRQYSGAVPLTRQEKFANALMKLQQDKQEIEKELKEVNNQRHQVEDKLAALELQHMGLQDLIATLKDGRGAEKVAEWHHKMEAVRLEELKLKRQLGRQTEQVKYLEGIIKKNEVDLLVMEEENVSLAKNYEDRQLQWEQREVELERIIAQMEKQQTEIAGAASQFEEASGALPDPTLPIANQLEHAVATIKNNVKTILETKAESKCLNERVTELEDEVRQQERTILSRDKVITELRLRLPATAGRDEMILKATAEATLAAKEEDYESRKALRVAQSTISSLQARVAQKEETVNKYQELLRQARDDMQEMNSKHEEELKLMQAKLHNKNDAAFSKFKQSAMDTISKAEPKLPTNKQLARLNELEDTVAEQDNAMSALSEKLKQAKISIEQLKEKYQKTVEAMSQEKRSLLEEHSGQISELEKELGDCRRQISEQQKEIGILQQELDDQKDANSKAPTTTMKNLVERLRNQLALKEKQHKALSKALMDVRSDMVGQAQEVAKAHADEHAAEINVQRVVDKHTKELKDQLEDFESQVTKLKKDLKRKREKESTLNTELEELKQDLTKREKQLSKVKADKQQLEQEKEDLEQKLSRMTAQKTQKGGDGANAEEMADLQRKIRSLQEELKRTKQAEKPYEQKDQEKQEGEQVVARWEESKKWQKTVDKLKAKLKEKEQELERLNKSHELTKNALERANRDKENAEHRLKSASKMPAPPPPAESGPRQHNMQELRRRNYELEDEVSNLKRQLTSSKDAAFEEVQMRNKFLTEKLEELERQMARKALTGQGGPSSTEAYEILSQKEQKLQKQMLKISEENIELRFEVEQAKKDLPRLKERIADLQNYIEVVKLENAELRGAATTRSTTSTSSIKRIGESGKSVRELEKTISLLKKVVERVQAENEQLKKAPGIITNEQLQELQMENQGLRDQLEELRQKMGATLSERYVSTQKGTAKIMADHEKMRKELRKEVENNEKLRISNKHLDATTEQLKRDLSECKKKLELESAKHPTLQSLDSKGWKSVVVTRMYEEKMKALEEDNEKKNKMLADVKVLLREAAEREQRLVHDKEELEEKMEILERYPLGTEAVRDSDVLREHQLARLKIDRMEKEKAELLHELEILRKQDNPLAGTEADVSNDEILAKLRSHDRVLYENVDLRTQVKTLGLEKERLNRELEKIRKELSNFGPEFFEEIEDLKYNYREAVQRNVQYEEQLSQLSKQFGVSVNIPGL